MTKAAKDRMELAAALEENERLKKRTDGSLFDLRLDTAQIIGTTIAANVPGKARAIANAILAALKKPTPAG